MLASKKLCHQKYRTPTYGTGFTAFSGHLRGLAVSRSRGLAVSRSRGLAVSRSRGQLRRNPFRGKASFFPASSAEILPALRWVDRGDGKGFGFLAVDTVPDYVDTAPIPPAAATWKYKAIYRLHDEQVGQWSAVVSLAVGT